MKSRMFRMLQLFAEETVDHTAEPDACLLYTSEES